jgi:flavin reductase (DIM6/NTAB) family NADH-FMN oxidoreductase RutF
MVSKEQNNDIDRDTFFSIMAAFPTGVAVVTTVSEDGTPKGLTTNAVASVSADPPMLLVCVGKTSRTLPALLATRKFTVNFMGADSHEICGLFASREVDKFSRVEWLPGEGRMPCLVADAVAWAECVIDQQYEAGDHVVLIARVHAGRAPDELGLPAVYFRRTYSALAYRK